MIPRVLWRSGPARALGPLGCYDRGQKLTLEGEEVVVTNIDHDGAGIAFKVSYLKQYAEDKGLSGESVMEKFSKYRSPDVDSRKANVRQRDQTTKTILANRAKHGLSAVDPREQEVFS